MATAYHIGKQGECERVRSTEPSLKSKGSWTPEPWEIGRGQQVIYGKGNAGEVAIVDIHNGMALALANASRIVACVNGSAGLNPAAYRACVEALKQVQDYFNKVEAVGKSYSATMTSKEATIIKQALAHAQEKEVKK